MDIIQSDVIILLMHPPVCQVLGTKRWLNLVTLLKDLWAL